MPSESDVRARGPSLRRRVAISSALVAAVVGLVSAGAAAVLLDRLSLAAEDQRLQDSATVLAHEIEAPDVDRIRAAEFEAREDEPLGIQIGIVEHGRVIAGSLAVPILHEVGCESAGEGLRACARGTPERLVVAAAADPARGNRRFLLVAVVVLVSAVSALIGALASNWLAGWALAPLTELGRKIASVQAVHPRQADLGPATGSSEVDALRRTIADLLDRLGTSLDHARSFGANAAHELRSPLAAMMVEIDLLRERGESEELLRLRKNVERLSILVDRLLSMSDAPSRPVEEIAVAVEDVVREVVTSRRPTERVRIDVAEGPSGMVRGDEALLRVAVDNLVDNALKFTDGRVAIEVAEEDNDVVVRVQDAGAGVSEEDGQRLVMPFVRGSSTVGGHGLGLAIAAHAIRLHGGTIHFSRSPKSEVQLRLPAWKGRATSRD